MNAHCLELIHIFKNTLYFSMQIIKIGHSLHICLRICSTTCLKKPRMNALRKWEYFRIRFLDLNWWVDQAPKRCLTFSSSKKWKRDGECILMIIWRMEWTPFRARTLWKGTFTLFIKVLLFFRVSINLWSILL